MGERNSIRRLPFSILDSVRINAFLASAGLGSRRAVEQLIRDGKVSVNGRIVRDLAARVIRGKDQVCCGGIPASPRRLHYVMLNKPRGYACTRSDPHMKKTVYDLLPGELRHLAHVGRLDVDSEGLLLLTNDGEWLNRMIHPRHGVSKIYEADVEGFPGEKVFKEARRGVRDKGEWLKVDSVEVVQTHARSTRLRMALREGKNREIRRLWGALRHAVISLKRIAIAELRLGSLKPGEWRELTEKERRQWGTVT